ncbi:hypothetical protein N7532_001812 [Penicillium argentinense]|uniref:Uncharacterized protein n=1 Tax=Penicillium argentinense TaxID=1131581 RepID=A0A9W9G4T7_9EURO|nr:uncharacterized protein N7532_001812 [Penicillium argentinense]KAJ5111277.1 hypothetical protein N7532_001812 [Penicillium argentinense]
MSLEELIRALEVIHSPTSTNELRKEALTFVESFKDDAGAARNGFLLASRTDNAPVVRYFGLTLMDHALRHLSLTDSEQIAAIRGMILELAEHIYPEDPNYFRNKIPQLLAEAAKKSWGLDWMDMDTTLVKFWGMTVYHNELVLSLLETLSEDVFFREDTVSSLRGSELNRALVEIFTPSAIVEQIHPDTKTNTMLRCGQEGWLVRISEFLIYCVENLGNSQVAKPAALKALKTLRSALSWSVYQAVTASQVVSSIFRSLTCQDEQILLAAVEALHALYGRNNMGNEDSHGLVCLIFEPDYLITLQNLYQWSIVSPEDVDEPKYLVSKKLSEMVSYIAACLEDKQFLQDTMNRLDLPRFFNFMVNIMQHQSLTVSIPALHLWSKLLSITKIAMSEFVLELTPSLLNICTQRLIRWESLPADSDDPTVQFLVEDIDTLPERHAFVGNYRRYCSSIIESVTRIRPEAVRDILNQVDENLNNLYSGLEPFTIQTFNKSAISIMRADAQFAVVEAVIKSFHKWEAQQDVSHLLTVDDFSFYSPMQVQEIYESLVFDMGIWAQGLMTRNFEDPVLKQRVVKLLVDISFKALNRQPDFALRVLEHILMTRLPDQPDYPAYAEAVKELHGLASHELRRLAMRYADHFSTFYDSLEPKIQEITNVNKVDDKLQMELTSSLMIIMQRATNVDPNLRQQRLAAFLEPVRQAWQDDSFRQASSSFDGFCKMLGLENVGSYMQAKQAQNFADWSEVALDNEGKVIQEQMTTKFQAWTFSFQVMLPLRGTKTMMSVSVDKLKASDAAYPIACDMWRDLIPQILPTLLQLVSHAHAFHNPANWAVSNEMRAVVERILTDRFWQAGISSGSRDDFYARITASKATLEGFASSVRGKIRGVRESCYSMLYSMSRMRDHFYGFAELPGPLSEALFKDSEHLSSHQFSVLLNVSRYLIDDCPVQYRGQYLPPMLATLFGSIDRKITSEWQLIEQRKNGISDGDLTDEMKSESVLRQLTYSAVLMAASLLDPQRGGEECASRHREYPSLKMYPSLTYLFAQDPYRNEAEPNTPQSMPSPDDSIRNFVLSSPEIFEPVMLFCTHALSMRDTRCCSIITRFICTEVLKAGITSVHEPYFVDMQKDLAQLIASIWVLYGYASETPRSVLLSLPGISESQVAQTEDALRRSSAPRQQRALVLDLLEPLRGISITEQGKIMKSREERRKFLTALQEKYRALPMETENENHRVDINDGPDLSGVADMFG